MIYVIPGRSGSGKTQALFERLKEAVRQKPAVLIVPEQSSFMNECRVLEELGPVAARRAEVLSFRRLCSNMFDEYGGGMGIRMDDGTKAVLMDLAIDQAPSEGGSLELYGKSAAGSRRRADLTDLMLTAVNEYKMCCISPEQLFQTAEGIEDRVLSAKLRDSARIYAAYDALLKDAYLDPDDDLTRLADILEKHSAFEGKVLLVDGFNGFSMQELRVLELMIRQSEEVYITICCDADAVFRKGTIFEESNQTIRSLTRIAERIGQKLKILPVPKPGGRFRTEPLKVLEEGLFNAYRQNPAPEPFTEEQDAVMLYEADDIYDEVAHGAEIISRLVEKQGYRYSDIEIITGDLKSYRSVIDSEFPKYEISYFISEEESLTSKPLIQWILSAFEVIHSGYDTEALLRYAKTGLVGLSLEKIAELENYAYIWGIKGKRWKSPFTMSPNGIEGDLDSTSGKDQKETKPKFRKIDQIEELRQKVIAPLESFEKALSQGENGGDITKALYSLMTTIEMQKHFRGFIYSLQKSEGDRTAQREAGVWDKAMNMLSKMYHSLKNHHMNSREYAELLKLYIKHCPVSDIPAAVNSVTIGAADRIRSASPKAVIIFGAIRSVFPAAPAPFGLFTNGEREFLREEDDKRPSLPLYDSIYGASLKEKYNTYAAMTAPCEKLFVSWHLRSMSGEISEPSELVDELRTLLPRLRTDSRIPVEDAAPEELFFTERQSFDLCTSVWRESTGQAKGLKKYYLQAEDYRVRAEAVDRAYKHTPFQLQQTDKMFTSPLYLSSTKLDTYTSCPFKYYCQFGLNAAPLRRAEIDSRIFGSAMHYIFEKVIQDPELKFIKEKDQEQMGTEQENTEELSEQEFDKKLKAAINKYLQAYIDSIIDEQESGIRFKNTREKIEQNAFLILKRIYQQFQEDQFKPVDFELRIGGKEDGKDDHIDYYKVTVSDGKEIRISGYVDRVDAFKGEDGKKYIRIVDYKTGNKKYALKNTANGMELQMLLYLSAIIEGGKKRYNGGSPIYPAGVLYVPAALEPETAQSASNQDQMKAVAEQEKKLRMNGLLPDDRDLLEKMEPELEGIYFPVLKKKNEPKKDENGKLLESWYNLKSSHVLIAPENFDSIFRYIRKCVGQTGESIFQGKIQADPMTGACSYCDYASICGFEKGSRTRKPESLNEAQAMKKIKAAVSQDQQPSKQQEEVNDESE